MKKLSIRRKNHLQECKPQSLYLSMRKIMSLLKTPQTLRLNIIIKFYVVESCNQDDFANVHIQGKQNLMVLPRGESL